MWINLYRTAQAKEAVWQKGFSKQVFSIDSLLNILNVFKLFIRPEIKEGDSVVYTNMPKLKKMPNTKKQRKYIGLYTVKRVTNSHAIVSDTQHSQKRKNFQSILCGHFIRVQGIDMFGMFRFALNNWNVWHQSNPKFHNNFLFSVF